MENGIITESFQSPVELDLSLLKLRLGLFILWVIDNFNFIKRIFIFIPLLDQLWR